MTRQALTRIALAAAGGLLAVVSFGCGWSSAQSRANTRTGVSESGYPGHGAPDPGSPALESMRRPGAKEMAEPGLREAARPGAKTSETHAPGHQ